MQKNIICDSSALISLADTGHLGALVYLCEHANLRFFVTPEVRQEITSRPMTIKKYALSAVRLQKCINDGTLKPLTSVTLHEHSQKLLKAANSFLFAADRPIELVQLGEAECVAIFGSASADALLIDEKTTRLIIENPYKLRESIQTKNGAQVRLDQQRKEELERMTKGILCMRSSELLAYAYEKGYFNDFGELKDEAFRASIYALRESGCGLASVEIVEYENMNFL